MKKRHKYIKRCKDALWKIWKYEYLVSLREKLKDKTFKINVGDVVMIKGEANSRGHWKIDIITSKHEKKNE